MFIIKGTLGGKRWVLIGLPRGQLQGIMENGMASTLDGMRTPLPIKADTHFVTIMRADTMEMLLSKAKEGGIVVTERISLQPGLIQKPEASS